MEDPQPRAGDVRIRVAFSGVNPGDVKKREDAFGVGMPYPRVIPHRDGSGTVDAVGDNVRGNGSVGASGVMALRVIVPSEPLPSTQWFP
jgi:NADPH:quinone reductase-like Zn-dependent oxidoreductase